jgi:hypothetical protein
VLPGVPEADAGGCRHGLTHVDWSADGLHVQTDSAGRGHHYWDARGVVERRDADEVLGHTQWATWTCVYGWAVQVLRRPGPVEGRQG